MYDGALAEHAYRMKITASAERLRRVYRDERELLDRYATGMVAVPRAEFAGQRP